MAGTVEGLAIVEEALIIAVPAISLLGKSIGCVRCSFMMSVYSTLVNLTSSLSNTKNTHTST